VRVRRGGGTGLCTSHVQQWARAQAAGTGMAAFWPTRASRWCCSPSGIRDPVRGTIAGTSLYDVIVRSAPTVPPREEHRVTARVTGRHGRAAAFAHRARRPQSRPQRRRRDNRPRRRAPPRPPSTLPRTQSGLSRRIGEPPSPGGCWLFAVADHAGHLPRGRVAADPCGHPGSARARFCSPPGVLLRADTTVVAVGEDGYSAAVTFGEDYVGGRPLLLSTLEDRVPWTGRVWYPTVTSKAAGRWSAR
jgi:hypothetical protein